MNMNRHPVIWSAGISTILASVVISGVGGVHVAGASQTPQNQQVTVASAAANPVPTVARGTMNVSGSVAVSPAPTSGGGGVLHATDVSPDRPFGYSAGGANPAGRTVSEVVDPTNGNRIFAASQLAGVWASTDGAHTWHDASTGLLNGAAAPARRPLALDENNTKRLLFATTDNDGRPAPGFGGLYSSVDGANTWQHVTLPCVTPVITDVAFSGGVGWVITRCGLYFSSTLTSWTATSAAAPFGYGAIAVSGATVYGCLGNTVWRSTNSGQSWVSSPALSGSCSDITLVPDDAANRVVVTDDGAVRDVSVVDFTGTPALTSLGSRANGCCGAGEIMTARRPNAAPRGGPAVSYDVFVSDGAYDWEYQPTLQPPWVQLGGGSIHVDSWGMATPLSYNPAAGVCTMYIGNDGGVYANTYNSPGNPCVAYQGPWVQANSGLHIGQPFDLTGVSRPNCGSPPRSCPALYISEQDNGSWGSVDGGTTWSDMGCCGDSRAAVTDPSLPTQLVVTRNGERVLYRSATPGLTWYLRDSNTFGPPDSTFTYGQAGDIPLSGDWTGKGYKTPGVYRSGHFLLRNSNTSGPADIDIVFGNRGDIPIVGDWTGSGVDTIGVVRSTVWYQRNSNTPGPPDNTFVYGSPGDVPLVGNWTGRGVDTPGIFRNGAFYLRNSNSTGPADTTFAFGTRGDTPVAGDWTAKGFDSVGVREAYQYHLRNSNAAGPPDINVLFGNDQDQAVTGNWTGPGATTIGAVRWEPPGPANQVGEIQPVVDCPAAYPCMTDGQTIPPSADLTQVKTLPGIAAPTNGDYFGVWTTATDDEIVRNINPSPQQPNDGWSVVSSGFFKSGSVFELQAAGGDANPTLYALAGPPGGDTGCSTTPTIGCKLYRGTVGGSWTQVSTNGLTMPIAFFVDPYDANVLYAMDYATSTIVSSSDGGASWSLKHELTRLATHDGEFNFACDIISYALACPLSRVVFERDHPEIRVATQGYGGAAFSRDGGVHWLPLVGSIQPTDTPDASFYDPQPNPATGNPSLYLALPGHGVTRVDAPFPTLEAVDATVPNVAAGHAVSLVDDTTGITTALHPSSDGSYRGTELIDSAVSGAFQYHFTIDGVSQGTLSHTLTAAETAGGVVDISGAPLPAPTSLSPTALQTGASGVTVTINGTGFLAGANLVTFTGPSTLIKTKLTKYVSTTKLTVTVNVGSAAALGAYTAKVVAPDGGVGLCSGCLTVTRGPVLTGIAPNLVARGTTHSVTLSGNSFSAGATVTGPKGVTFSHVVVMSTTSITATMTVAATAPTGANLPVTVIEPLSVGAGRASRGCLTIK
jgi:hypothetical protein